MGGCDPGATQQVSHTNLETWKHETSENSKPVYQILCSTHTYTQHVHKGVYKRSYSLPALSLSISLFLAHWHPNGLSFG